MSYSCMRYETQLTPIEQRMIVKAIVESVKADPDGWRFNPPRATYRDRLTVLFGDSRGLIIESPYSTHPLRYWRARKAIKALHRLRHSRIRALNNPRVKAITEALEVPTPEPIDITPTLQPVQPRRVPLAA